MLHALASMMCMHVPNCWLVDVRRDAEAVCQNSSRVILCLNARMDSQLNWFFIGNLTATNYTHGYYTHAHTLMDAKRIRDKSDGLGPSNKRPRILIIPNLTRQTGIGPPNGYCRQRLHSKRTGQVSNSLPLHRVQGVIWNFSLSFSCSSVTS